MLFFCPMYGKWFEYLDNDRLNQYRTPENLITGRESKTIIDLWNTVSAPPAPQLKPVSLPSKTTALLILDMETSICKSPRCIASISSINKLLREARKKEMLIVYSITHNGNPQDIAKQIAPTPNDPIVRSSVDKFYKTNLEKILQKKGIKTVIVTGFAANGAVLSTATSAAFRGYNIVVPVDCMSTANILYAEQYTAWHMLNSPATRDHSVLTRADLISLL